MSEKLQASNRPVLERQIVSPLDHKHERNISLTLKHQICEIGILCLLVQHILIEFSINRCGRLFSHTKILLKPMLVLET